MNKKELTAILKNHKAWLNGQLGAQRANLWGANLRGADLWGANLRGVDLRGANLPSSPELLLCYWGAVSDKLTTALMRYDATNHPDPTKFTAWAQGAICPYSIGFSRSANFHEKRLLWKPGKAKSARELVLMLFKEKEIKHDENL